MGYIFFWTKSVKLHATPLFIALAFRNRLECYCADGCITARIPLHRRNLVSFHPATLEFTGLECIWIVLGLIWQHLLRGSTARLSGLLVMRLCHAFPGFCLLWDVAFKQFLNRTGEKPFIQSRINTAELRSELCMQQHGYYICNMYSIYPILIAKNSCKKFNSFFFIIDHFTKNSWVPNIGCLIHSKLWSSDHLKFLNFLVDCAVLSGLVEWVGNSKLRVFLS